MYLSSEENWRMFFPKARQALVQRQADNGSWNTGRVGDVYSTAIALTALQLPYRHLPILQR